MNISPPSKPPPIMSKEHQQAFDEYVNWWESIPKTSSGADRFLEFEGWLYQYGPKNISRDIKDALRKVDKEHWGGMRVAVWVEFKRGSVSLVGTLEGVRNRRNHRGRYFRIDFGDSEHPRHVECEEDRISTLEPCSDGRAAVLAGFDTMILIQQDRISPHSASRAREKERQRKVHEKMVSQIPDEGLQEYFKKRPLPDPVAHGELKTDPKFGEELIREVTLAYLTGKSLNTKENGAFATAAVQLGRSGERGSAPSTLEKQFRRLIEAYNPSWG